MTALKEGWPCREPGCRKAAVNVRYCGEHTMVRAVFGDDEPVADAAPCPFCGAAAKLRTIDQVEFFLVCPGCDAHGPPATGEARAVWAFGIRAGAHPLDPAERGTEPCRVEGEPAPGAGPCPFCGGSDLYFERVGKPGAEIASNSVVCRTCEAAGPAVRGGSAEAVGMWNIRREGPCGSRE